MSDFYKGYYEDHCFAHHGILGQKWGIRRYQNKDGSLTKAGRERYTLDIKSKLDAGDVKGAADVLKSIKGVRKFREQNESSVRLAKAAVEEARFRNELNKEANRIGQKAVGGKSFNELLSSGRHDLIAVYIQEGKKYAQSKEVTDKLKKILTERDEAERQWEKEGREYIDKLFGEDSKIEINNPMAVKYNMKTKKIEKQTLGDMMGYEMYRWSGGKPRG